MTAAANTSNGQDGSVMARAGKIKFAESLNYLWRGQSLQLEGS
jgi:hypothetical protein